MDKVEEFKEFVKSKPNLKKKVDNNEATWQSLYETFDMYGKDHESFNVVYEKETKVDNNNLTGIGGLLKIFEGVDVNKVSENLEGIKKVLGVLGEFSKKDEPKSSRKDTIKPFRRFDD